MELYFLQCSTCILPTYASCLQDTGVCTGFNLRCMSVFSGTATDTTVATANGNFALHVHSPLQNSPRPTARSLSQGWCQYN